MALTPPTLQAGRPLGLQRAGWHVPVAVTAVAGGGVGVAVVDAVAVFVVFCEGSDLGEACSWVGEWYRLLLTLSFIAQADRCTVCSWTGGLTKPKVWASRAPSEFLRAAIFSPPALPAGHKKLGHSPLSPDKSKKQRDGATNSPRWGGEDLEDLNPPWKKARPKIFAKSFKKWPRLWHFEHSNF